MHIPSQRHGKRLVARLLVIAAWGWSIAVWATVMWTMSRHSLAWIPAAAATIPLFFPLPIMTAAVACLTLGFAVIAGFSIGLFYVVPALMLFVAAELSRRVRQRS